MATHDIGDVVTLWAIFRNSAGAQTATTATLMVRTPDGEETEATVAPAQASDEAAAEAATGETLSGVTGVYKATIDIDQSGRWEYRWEGSGAVTEATEGQFRVRRQHVGGAGS